jgi:ribonuclease III
MEAFIGAVYLDKGFGFTQKFIVKRLVQPHLDLEKIVSTNSNFKSILIEWVQRMGKEVDFEIINEKGDSHHKYFTAQVLINSEPVSQGTGQNKKKAEQAAAENACKILIIK